MIKNLSKSKILSGLQCPKRLYLEVHHPELAQVSEATERVFDIGHQVGEVARRQFPNGRLIEHQDNLSEAIKETARVLEGNEDITIYEGTFAEDGVLVRADIFKRENEGYRLIEVKAATGIKDYYLTDVAVQAWVIGNCGFPLNRIELAHVDNTFVYRGDGDYSGLFKIVDVKDRVIPLVRLVPSWVSDLKKVLAGDMPCVKIGTQCSDPFECPFIGYCTPTDYPEFHVSILPHGGKVVDELLEEGIEDVRDIPENRLTKEAHERVRRVTVSGVPEISAEIRNLAQGIPYPRFYLDFETAQFAVPIWKGTRPYEQLPVQWSCHVEKEDGNLEHREFLDVSGTPPMKRFIETLIDAVGDRGSIIVYSSFEKTILRKLVEMYPEYADGIEKIIGRLVDLLPLVRNGYYHPEMKGSWSIKSILPCVAPELNYESLTEIREGGAAQAAYKEAVVPETTAARKAEIRDSLLAYCKMDTLAMVKLVQFFSAL